MENVNLLEPEIIADGNGEIHYEVDGHHGERRGSLESLHFTFASSKPQEVSFWQRRCFCMTRLRWMLILILVFAALAVLLFLLHQDDERSHGSSALSDWRKSLPSPPDFSRCPSSYADNPVLLVMSMDGFAPAYLNHTPIISLLASHGLTAPHMRPVFPANTFPNHYSIVTGLYPESHGIIDNYFVDPSSGKTFVLTNSSMLDPSWWKGVPIWEVAQEQGLRVYAHYWPGSEVAINGKYPTYYSKFNMEETVESRASTIIDWLHLPKTSRPHLILNYYHMPDLNVHRYGPDAQQTIDVLRQADSLVRLVLEGIHDAGLRDCINLIVLSDHGAGDCKQSIHPLESLKALAGDKFEKMFVDPFAVVQNRIDPTAAGISVKDAVEALSCESEFAAHQVYSRDSPEDLPIRLHYHNSPRVPPIILLSNVSTALQHSADGTCASHRTVHGWDPIYLAMQAVFIAYGPSFKPKTVVEPFANIELFGLFCELLGIKSVANNGTSGSLRHLLRIPPVGDWEAPDSMKRILMDATSQAPIDGFHFEDLCEKNVQSCEQNAPLILPRTAEDMLDFLQLHVGSYGVPAGTNLRIRISRHYTMGISKQFNTALWASFNMVAGGTYELYRPTNGSTCFAIDSDTSSLQAHCDVEHRSPSVIRAPLYPFKCEGKSADGNGVLSSSLLPVYRSFWDTRWKSFWNRVAQWADRSVDGRIQATVGPIFDHDAPFGTADKDTNRDSQVPSHLFVILTRRSVSPRCHELSCFTDVAAFVFPNTAQTSKPCQSETFWLLTRSATVRDIERLTNLRFFTSIPPNEAARLKTRLLDTLWDMDSML